MIKKLKKYSKTVYFSVLTITALVISVLGVMLFWNVASFQPSNTSQTIYFADNISPSHRLLVDLFNKKHEGKIKVIPIDLPFEKFSTNERKELLIRYLRSKSDKVDVFSVDQIWVPRFAKWTEPLNKYITPAQSAQIHEQALKTCYYKDNLVALPLYFDVGMLYVNNKVIQKIPNYAKITQKLENFITWEDFVALGMEIKKNGQPFYLFAADDYEGLMCSFVELIASQNKKLFEGDSIRLQTKECKKSLHLLVDLVNKYGLSPKSVLEARESQCYRTFIAEDGFFLRGWSGLDAWYKYVIAPVDVSDDYTIVPVPHFAAGRPASIVGGWNLMLSKYSTKKSEAMEFIRFLISEEAQKIMYENGGYLPVNKSIYSDEKYCRENPQIKLYKKLIVTGVHRPFLDKYTRCSDILAHYLNRAIAKEISVDDALATAEQVINSGEFFIK